MANERLKKDQNYVSVIGAVTNDSAQEVVQARANGTTKRILVEQAALDYTLDSVSIPPKTDIEGKGNISVSTSEVAITINGTPTDTIRIQADNNNTGIIYIGKTGIANNGSNDFVRLESGDDAIIRYNDVTNALYAISSVAGGTINVGAIL